MEWLVRRPEGGPGAVGSLAAYGLFHSVLDCRVAPRPPSAFPSVRRPVWACELGERYVAPPSMPQWQRQGVVWSLVHFSVGVREQGVPCSWRPDVLLRVGGASVNGGLHRTVSCSPFLV